MPYGIVLLDSAMYVQEERSLHSGEGAGDKYPNRSENAAIATTLVTSLKIHTSAWTRMRSLGLDQMSKGGNAECD